MFKKTLNYLSPLLLLFTLSPVDSFSAPSESELNELETDQELLDELLGIVDESTDIATQTHMNTNYVPGTVTVLEGKELEALGVSTAWDALAFVPGILPTKDATGGPSVVARGLNFPFSSGNIKILVNSLAMTQESSGINSSILQIPIEQIQRIEIVRGPGAILYGDNAFMGLVNIVTYNDEQRAFVRYENSKAATGGGMGFYENAEHKLKIHANASGYGNNQADSPKAFDAEEDRQFGVFSLAYEGLDIQFQSYHREFDPIDQEQGYSKEGNDMVNIRQTIAYSSKLVTTVNFSYLYNKFERSKQSYKGDKMEGSIALNWTGLKKHNMSLKFTYTGESIDSAFLGSNSDLGELLPAQTNTNTNQPQRVARAIIPPNNRATAAKLLGNGNQPGNGNRPGNGNPEQPSRTDLSLTDIKRQYLSLSLQDQFDITDYLALTVGLRYDYRKDIDKHIFTPRVSAVWRVTDEHIIKAQYAEGFRVPTFFELYTREEGQNDLGEEKIATSEVSYIFHQPEHTGKVTFFYSQLRDMIFPVQGDFSNRSHAQSWGVEVEWEQQITERLSWLANFSYVDSWDTRNADGEKQEDSVATSWLSNISLFYRPIDQVLLTAHWHYTGARDKETLDIPANNQLEFTINTFDVFTQGLDFKLGVKNVIGESEFYINKGLNNDNVMDFGHQTTVWTQLSYRF
ncbi:MAG: TonB-dependent receptor [Methyloprofundus sp.]|nr:TonB-dependent receptor [Methyloprofundus sp.]